jgi:transposase InsO family protein
MELWQLDIMGGVMLADGTEVKPISGIDDASRYCVLAHLVSRATGRAVTEAFLDAMSRYGLPEEVLTDNGKQFTGRFGPHPAEVLFERACRHFGIAHRKTGIRTPTTTGKVERLHRTVRTEFLTKQAPFDTLQAAQAALDNFVAGYNTTRPHQALDLDPPAARFRPAALPELPLRLALLDGDEPVTTLPAAPTPTAASPPPERPSPNSHARPASQPAR